MPEEDPSMDPAIWSAWRSSALWYGLLFIRGFSGTFLWLGRPVCPSRMDLRPHQWRNFFRGSISGGHALLYLRYERAVWHPGLQHSLVFAGNPCGGIFAIGVSFTAGSIPLEVFICICTDVVFDCGCSQCRAYIQHVPAADYAAIGIWPAFTVFMRPVSRALPKKRVSFQTKRQDLKILLG